MLGKGSQDEVTFEQIQKMRIQPCRASERHMQRSASWQELVFFEELKEDKGSWNFMNGRRWGWARDEVGRRQGLISASLAPRGGGFDLSAMEIH